VCELLVGFLAADHIQLNKMKGSGDENGPYTLGDDTVGGLTTIAVWPCLSVVVARPESVVVLGLAADAMGAAAIAAAAIPVMTPAAM
jgi:hypothetical protein